MSTILTIILGIIIFCVAISIISVGLKLVTEILAAVTGFLVYYWLLPIVLAGLSYWIFERFWLGLIIGLIITLIIRYGEFDSGNTSSSSSSRPHSQYQRSSSSSSSTSDRGREEDRKKRGRYDMLMAQAEDALREHRYYKSKAEDAFRQADIEKRYGEQYARSDDELDQSYARECFSKAERELDEAREFSRKAENCYERYEDLKYQAKLEL